MIVDNVIHLDDYKERRKAFSASTVLDAEVPIGVFYQAILEAIPTHHNGAVLIPNVGYVLILDDAFSLLIQLWFSSLLQDICQNFVVHIYTMPQYLYASFCISTPTKFDRLKIVNVYQHNSGFSSWNGGLHITQQDFDELVAYMGRGKYI